MRLVSGVTISVLEKSVLPSPGCGIGKPTPIPAATCAGTTAVDVIWELVAPAGGMIAKLTPDGIMTLSFPLPVGVEDGTAEFFPMTEVLLGAKIVAGLLFADALVESESAVSIGS